MYGRFETLVRGNSGWRRRLIAGALLALFADSARAERLKDLTSVQGVRANQLVGYGLVVGLAQTGDDYNVPFTQQSILALLRRMGMPATDGQLLHTRDTAAVLVTATLPAFARSGGPIDVNVAALGNSFSLQGGVLISTPLRGADGRAYAVAQGPLLIGGALAAGASGSLSLRNHVTTGRIPGGALVERDPPSGMKNDSLTFLLKNPDFTTANRIAVAIEHSLASTAEATDGEPARLVRAIDAGAVEVKLPGRLRDQTVALAAQLEEVEVDPDVPARVVVNERTGVVVVGTHAMLGAAAVSYGRLTVKIDEERVVSQPFALAAGQTAVVPQTRVQQNEARGLLVTIPSSKKVEDVVQSLNQLGASPRDLISILQALKASGSLRSELIIE